MAGQVVHHDTIRRLARSQSMTPPRAMPRTLQAADIYAHHLVVINEWCRALGYKGLLLIFDEAEHVLGFQRQSSKPCDGVF